jgi:predicted amidohydrolase
VDSNLLDEIVVTIGQSIHDQHITNYLDKANDFKYLEPHVQLDILDSIMKVAEKDKSQFVLLPEFFLPRKYLWSHIKARATRYNCIIMGGLEYGVSPYLTPTNKTRLKNEAFIVIPDNLFKTSATGTSANATILTFQKLHPAPDEKKLLEDNNYEFSYGNRIYLFQSEVLGRFAVLICFDFLNLPIQAILQSQIEILFVLTYNKDVAGFISVADTMQRMLLCNVVICNTGFFGGSVAFTPLRDRNKRQVLQINGNNIHAAVTVHLPLKELREVQKTGNTDYGMKKKSKEEYERTFMQRPPDFGRLASR